MASAATAAIAAATAATAAATAATAATAAATAVTAAAAAATAAAMQGSTIPMTPTSAYDRYLLAAIRSWFGPVVTQVAHSLRLHGAQTVQALHVSTQVALPRVKETLLVLIQHGLVQLTVQNVKKKTKPKRKEKDTAASSSSLSTNASATDGDGEEEAEEQVMKVQYRLDADQVRLRVRFAQYIMVTKELLGPYAESIVQTCAQHGRLSTRQLMDMSMASHQAKQAAQSHLSRVTTVPAQVMQHELELSFKQLLNARLLQRAPTIAKSSSASSPTDMSSSSKSSSAAAAAAAAATTATGTKRKRATKNADPDVASAAAPAARGRKRTKAADSDDATKSSTSGLSTSPLPFDMSSSPVDDSGNPDEVLWMLNCAQFIHLFRTQTIVDQVATFVNPTAGAIVRAMLSRYPNDHTRRGPAFHADDILQLLAEGPDRPRLNKTTLVQYLDELLRHKTLFFQRLDTGYYIEYAKLFSELRLQHIQSAINERFGDVAGRIFRILIEYERLEETQVAEYATAPRKQVRDILHQMLRGEYVTLHEVPRTSDRAPTRTFFLWSVNVDAAHTTFLNQVYTTCANLRSRLDFETERIHPLIDKVDTQKHITEAEKQRIEAWKKGSDRIEATLFKLNDVITLFCDAS